jgi:hypothetical protein
LCYHIPPRYPHYDDYEEILSYNELMDYIEKDEQQHQDEDGNGFWNFKHIVGHEGPFRTSNPEYKGSRYNVLMNASPTVYAVKVFHLARQNLISG